MTTIKEKLIALSESNYKAFNEKLVPNINSDTVLGVRMPAIRKMAKEIKNDPETEEFLKEMPHGTYEEMMLHGVLIGEMKDYDRIINELNRFLPYVDNWAVCDSTRIPAFKKHHDKLMDECRKWISSKNTYTCRYGIDQLMDHYLDKDFTPEVLKMAASIQSEEYYINMAIAWMFATALAKQWEATFPYIEKNILPIWVHNKTIQKAIESYRITDAQKTLLRTYKRAR